MRTIRKSGDREWTIHDHDTGEYAVFIIGDDVPEASFNEAWRREHAAAHHQLDIGPDGRKRQLGARVEVDGDVRTVTSVRRHEDVLGLDDGSFVNANGVKLLDA